MKYIEFAKLSKKKQREINKSKRRDWHGVDPRMKVVESRKVYRRTKVDWLREI